MERDYLKELADHKNAEKRYKITSLERDINDLRIMRNRSLYITGLFLLIAGAIPALNHTPEMDYLTVQANAVISFEALKHYFEMLGPASTFLCGGALATGVRSAVCGVKLNRKRNDLETYIQSYENMEEPSQDSTYTLRR
jgi:hypothetical protein